MGSFRFLPTTTKARLALAASLVLTYVVGATVYMRFLRYGESAFPLLQSQADETEHILHNETEPISTPYVSRVLLVSAFFPLNTSKIPQSDYDMWLHNYLGSITTDVYLYTTPELGARVEAFKSESMSLTVDTMFNSTFQIPPLQGKEKAYTTIRKKDRERPRHSIESYAVLNSKPFFLQNAVTALAAKGVAYDYIFWNDATSFHHEHNYRQWPSPGRLDEIWAEGSQLTGTKKEDLLFVPMWGLPHKTMELWWEGMGPIESKFSEGSFFGGAPAAVEWYARTFYAYHDYYLSLEIFIGKDQALLNALFLLFPSRFMTVWYNDPEAPAHLALNRTDEQSFLGQCDSEWFYYRFWLADPQTQDAMRDQWIAAARRWRLWGWWNPRDTTSCQDTRMLGMTDMLKRIFGSGWSAPGHGVDVSQTITWTLPEPSHDIDQPSS